MSDNQPTSQPESNMDIQQRIGADICMQLDQCIGYPCEKEDVAASTALSWEWAKRCCDAHTRIDQALFAIVQGGMHLDLRLESVRRLLEIDTESRSSGGRGFQGFGIGGYSVGEPHDVMFETLGQVTRALPDDRPRYLMGVGNPTTLVRAVREGVDMIERREVALVFGVAHVHTALAGKRRAHASRARRQHAIEHVHALARCARA